MVFLWIYSLPLGLWFSIGFMVFFRDYGSPLDLRLCLSLGFMSFVCSFGSVYTVIWKRRGVLRTQSQGGVVEGKSISHHRSHSPWQSTQQRRVYGDTGMTVIDRAMGSIYSGDPGVDRTSSYQITNYTLYLLRPEVRNRRERI
jgi:hypothetical protein